MKSYAARLLGDIFLSFLPNLGLKEHIWAEQKVLNVAKKLGFTACIWLAGANSQKWVQYSPYFPARMTCVEPYCQITWEHFPQLCVKLIFELWRSNWVLCLWHQPISKMGYFKCTILFNICTISFLSCYDSGCTITRSITYLWVFLISEVVKIGATKPFLFGFWFP